MRLKDANQVNGIKAYRYLVYECPNADEITDEGKEIAILCKSDGSFQVKFTFPLTDLLILAFKERTAPFPKCRAAVSCSQTPPLPPDATGLANSSSTATTEGDAATYECAESSWAMTLDGETTTSFNVTCGVGGVFPAEVNWPTCQDPLAVFNVSDQRRCHCPGDNDLTAMQAKMIR